MLGPATAALLVDMLAGEPPARLHPTVWMGRWIANGRARRRSSGNLESLLEGTLLVAGGVALAAMGGRAGDALVDAMPQSVRALVRGAALKPAMSLRGLIDAAGEVRVKLERNRLDDARRSLGWHLVSRDTRTLSAAEVAGAAIESVAENLGDAFVAPLLACRAGGLAAAYAYRMINTADAMLGYRTPELEWFGKAGARLDDAVNLVPSRVAAALICATAFAGNGSPRRAAQAALHDASRTPSPNAGWPMSAMAGALGLRLTKRDTYVLNPHGRDATPRDIARCCRITLAAGVAFALLVDMC